MQDVQAMQEWIIAESIGHYFFYAFPVCLVMLFLLMKARRIRFLIPSVVITLVVVNPLFYRYWDNLGFYAYWRILWIVPVVPVIAALVPAVVEKVDSVAGENALINSPRLYDASKFILIAIGVVGIIFGGSFVYNTSRGQFEVPTADGSKVPGFVVDIADKLLELDEHPRVIAQDPIGVYIRQYTGSIDTLFGRDASGYIASMSSSAKKVNSILNEKPEEMDTISQFMIDDGYDYLVYAGSISEEHSGHFELIDTVGNYGIYKAIGKPSVIKEKNELGQVLSIQTVDESGNPVNNESGYSLVSYQYDDNGFVIREFRTDIDGNGVADKNGFAGYERKYDRLGHILSEITLNPDGKAATNQLGYAEVRQEYDGIKLFRESYYDMSGNPVNRSDVLYASVDFQRDNNGYAVDERYYDADGRVVVGVNGYAEVRRKFDQKQLVKESYYGTDGNPTLNSRGYASLSREYDSYGNVIEESYYDCSGVLTNQLDGYAQNFRAYDAARRIISQRFLDMDHNLVVVYTGYAEVHRTYDDNGRLIKEEYYGTDGQPLVQSAGHVAIEQEWDGDKLLVRRYLDMKGSPITRIDGYSEAVWTASESRTDVHLVGSEGDDRTFDHLNLAKDITVDSNGWSQWMIPMPNKQNSTFNIGFANLGEKQDGDLYTCQIEIEFQGVTVTDGQQFRFWTQGAQDNKWNVGNIWDGSLANLYDVPADGVYVFTSTREISGEMANVSTFDIGFRCDYWSSGMFRVKNVKVEKGEKVSKWSPGI